MEELWQSLSWIFKRIKLPFEWQLRCYQTLYPDWQEKPRPAWFPKASESSKTALGRWMLEKGYQDLNKDYPAFHRWSSTYYQAFWSELVKRLEIRFDQQASALVDLQAGVEAPRWFPEAKLNIAKSCFQAKPEATALSYQEEGGRLRQFSYKELDQLSNRIANGLKRELKKGERAAIIMPITIEAVAIFLGLIKSGCTVVAIPDSFSAEEIATRIRISDTKLVFCQDIIIRAGKNLGLYERLIKAKAPRTIVLPAEKELCLKLEAKDCAWADFLSEDKHFEAESMSPQDLITILFSSGTTGEPKAIPWHHYTPIKCASDALLHQNITEGATLCWPSNLGWMMGPWQIFAALINKATLAIYNGSANERAFGLFVQEAAVTHLGVVPTLVRNWRNKACMEGLNWKKIQVFTSTAERSNVEDMLYLMWLGNYRPIIEYCGGTEIAGAYLTGTLVQACVPAAFSTPALGLDLVLLNEQGQIADKGEVALIPPSIGLSTELLNKSHHQVYYEGMPTDSQGHILRRHGDELIHYPEGYYRLLGRVDDTMKLGGIKISSAEIETLLNPLEGIDETAAIAITPQDGRPNLLVIYAVLKENYQNEAANLKAMMQSTINQQLNPLFKIHEVIVTASLPRTASNKVMRRVLRDQYLRQQKDSFSYGST